MKKSRLFIISLLVLCCLSTVFSFTALAGDDNIPYSFTMKSDLCKNYIKSEYRETSRTNNPCHGN